MVQVAPVSKSRYLVNGYGNQPTVVMLICRGKMSHLQVVVLIYCPNITFQSLDGGLGKSQLVLLYGYSLFRVSFFLN